MDKFVIDVFGCYCIADDSFYHGFVSVSGIFRCELLHFFWDLSKSVSFTIAIQVVGLFVRDKQFVSVDDTNFGFTLADTMQADRLP